MHKSIAAAPVLPRFEGQGNSTNDLHTYHKQRVSPLHKIHVGPFYGLNLDDDVYESKILPTSVDQQFWHCQAYRR